MPATSFGARPGRSGLADPNRPHADAVAVRLGDEAFMRAG